MAGLLDLAQIAAYVKKSEKTTLKMIREDNLPAVKVRGAWVSDTALIDRWRQWTVVKSMNGSGTTSTQLQNELEAVLQAQ